MCLDTIKGSTLSQKTRFTLGCFFLLAGVEGLVCSGVLIFDQIHKQKGTLLAPPTTWILAIISVILVTLIFLFLTVILFKKSPRTDNLLAKILVTIKKAPFLARWIVPIGCLVYLIFLFLVDLKFGSNNLLLSNLMATISTWFYLLVLESLIVFIILRPKVLYLELGKPFFITLSFFILTWLLIAATGIGIIPDDRYWNVAGVPVLAKQLAFILIISTLVVSLIRMVQNKPRKSSRWVLIVIDIMICFALWGFAIVLWINAPFENSFFAEGPILPNNDFYPYSDAALMDLGGQYMLIGEGLNYPFFTEKTLYVFFLGMLHFFVGQNYIATTSLQIVIFAVFPVLIYLLGRTFSGRLLGLSVALFALIKESNAIAATLKISVSNSRLYMTEFPTTIAMVALGLALFLWYRNPDRKNPWIIISGGILGFSMMIRTNSLFILPILFIFTLLIYKFHWKKFFISSLIFVGGFLLAVGPWITYSQMTYGTNPYTSKIEAVLFYRFGLGHLNPSPISNQVNDRFLINFDQPASQTSTSSTVESDLKVKTVESDLKVQTIAGHFLNNEIKALFILPFQLFPQTLNTTLDLPYWKEPIIWKGKLDFTTAIAFGVNLILIALGISHAWKSWHIPGLVPLMLNISYYLSNALGRTSGSRYLLAVDWTIYFYFILGIIVVILWLKNMNNKNGTLDSSTSVNHDVNKTVNKRFLPTILIGIIILFLGSSIPLINNAFPKLYNGNDREGNIEQLASIAGLEESGLAQDQIERLMEQPNGTIIRGRLLYPRYLTLTDTGQTGLFLTVLTPEIKEVFFPMDENYTKIIEAGTDVLVIGCIKNDYIESILGYVPETNNIIRSDLTYTDKICD